MPLARVWIYCFQFETIENLYYFTIKEKLNENNDLFYVAHRHDQSLWSGLYSKTRWNKI